MGFIFGFNLIFRFALNFWLYSTFDNVDGKQARRTNTSSPLGELFDHGCDALTIVVISSYSSNWVNSL